MTTKTRTNPRRVWVQLLMFESGLMSNIKILKSKFEPATFSLLSMNRLFHHVFFPALTALCRFWTNKDSLKTDIHVYAANSHCV